MYGNKAARLAQLEAEGVISCGRRTSPQEQADIDAGRFGRTEAGDVTNLRAFDVHMDLVGEEDQSVPGWDQGA